MKPFDSGIPLTEIRRRIRGEGADDLPAPSGRQPERIGGILRRMREKGELLRAKAE